MAEAHKIGDELGWMPTESKYLNCVFIPLIWNVSGDFFLYNHGPAKQWK